MQFCRTSYIRILRHLSIFISVQYVLFVNFSEKGNPPDSSSKPNQPQRNDLKPQTSSVHKNTKKSVISGSGVGRGKK